MLKEENEVEEEKEAHPSATFSRVTFFSFRVRDLGGGGGNGATN